MHDTECRTYAHDFRISGLSQPEVALGELVLAAADGSNDFDALTDPWQRGRRGDLVQVVATSVPQRGKDEERRETKQDL